MKEEDLDAAVQRLLDDRERQGLPRHVEDPVVLAKIAEIIKRVLWTKEGRRGA